MGESIRELRLELGMSQERLAREVGVTQGAVWQWEHGISTPTVARLRKLAFVLNCSVEDLMK